MRNRYFPLVLFVVDEGKRESTGAAKRRKQVRDCSL